MGVKMKLLPSLCKVPSCTQKPQTTSFRISSATKDDIFKTINSVYVDQESDMVETPDSWFTKSPESGSGSVSEDYDGSSSTSISGDTHLEALVRGAQQSSSADHRLFFDPTGDDSSPKLSPCSNNTTSDVRNLIPKQNNTPFKESVAMSLESEEPYEDFKRSMEEMAESLGEDWEGLEELLAWYLKVNGRKYHAYIIRAFIDLLAEIFGNNNVEEVTTSFSSAAASSLSSSASCSDDLICS